MIPVYFGYLYSIRGCLFPITYTNKDYSAVTQWNTMVNWVSRYITEQWLLKPRPNWTYLICLLSWHATQLMMYTYILRTRSSIYAQTNWIHCQRVFLHQKIAHFLICLNVFSWNNKCIACSNNHDAIINLIQRVKTYIILRGFIQW